MNFDKLLPPYTVPRASDAFEAAWLRFVKNHPPSDHEDMIFEAGWDARGKQDEARMARLREWVPHEREAVKKQATHQAKCGHCPAYGEGTACGTAGSLAIDNINARIKVDELLRLPPWSPDA